MNDPASCDQIGRPFRPIPISFLQVQLWCGGFDWNSDRSFVGVATLIGRHCVCYGFGCLLTHAGEAIGVSQ